MNRAKKILVVEDNSAMAKELQRVLKDEGVDCTVAGTLTDARKALKGSEFHLVLLDVNLPDGLGFQLCREIREDDSGLPVLFLTERGDEDSVVKGLSMETTDYMRKPFSARELLLRIRKLTRTAADVLLLGDLAVDGRECSVKWKGKAVDLTPREFEVLNLLAQNLGRLVTREKMADRTMEGEVSERTFNSYLSRLRTKLAAAGVTGFKITAVYGEGYRLERE